MGMTIHKLRAAMLAATDPADLERLRGEYRALPARERGLYTAEGYSDYERNGTPSPVQTRRVIFRPFAPIPQDERDAAADVAKTPTMYGHFAVFDTWSEIESFWEGNFMEAIAPGAFATTIANDRERMRVTLNHGRDPFLGNKPLGTINTLAEDKRGAAYEVGLFDNVPPLVMEGLRAAQYGASFRFRIISENVNEKPTPSKTNLRGIPEHILTEVQVDEFGPVTFPQYPEASARVRSLVSSATPVTPRPAAGRSARGNFSPKELEECLRSLS